LIGDSYSPISSLFTVEMLMQEASILDCSSFSFHSLTLFLASHWASFTFSGSVCCFSSSLHLDLFLLFESSLFRESSLFFFFCNCLVNLYLDFTAYWMS
jgi:hypothetical protein